MPSTKTRPGKAVRRSLVIGAALMAALAPAVTATADTASEPVQSVEIANVYSGQNVGCEPHEDGVTFARLSSTWEEAPLTISYDQEGWATIRAADGRYVERFGGVVRCGDVKLGASSIKWKITDAPHGGKYITNYAGTADWTLRDDEVALQERSDSALRHQTWVLH